MSRFIILTLLVVCFVCIYQAYGAPADKSDEAAKDVSDWTDSIKKTFENIKPGLEKFGQDAKNFFKDSYATVSEKIKTVIPKTD